MIYPKMNNMNQFPIDHPNVEIRFMQGEAEAAICARMMASSDPWRTLRRDEASLLKAVLNPQREAYVAVIGGHPAGLILLNMQGAFIGYIQSLCVAEGWRGGGLGQRLIEFAEERIFRQTPNVFLCVSSFNSSAQRFYERLGYVRIGILKDYLISGHDEILMRKSVAPLAEFTPPAGP